MNIRKVLQMKKLYITDLDGTLLRGDQTLSHFTSEALGRLIENGLCFSYATARSAKTAGAVMKSVNAPTAAVVYNGAFIVETKSKRRLCSNAFSSEESKKLLDTVLDHGIAPRVYSLISGEERFTYTEKHLLSEGAREYFRTRAGDSRARLTADEALLYEGEIFLVSCCDKKEVLVPLYEVLKNEYQCHFYADSYSADQYLEIVPLGATKENGAKILKKIYGCDRIIAFGDGVNDIPLFRAADECYAVSNACPELKEIATGIIGSNEEDGVARWLLENLTEIN